MSNRTCLTTNGPAAAVIRLALAYQASHALFVATQIGIWDIMSRGPCTAAEIATRTGMLPDPVQRLLRALAAFELMRDADGGRFELTAMGRCLCTSSPHSVQSLILMYGSEHARLIFGYLEKCISTGRSAFDIAFGAKSGFHYLQDQPALAKVFNDGMSAASKFTGAAITSGYDFTDVRHVIDVGGGHGEVLARILHAHPNMQGTLVDLPSVAEGARSKIAEEGLADRCTIVAGDMFRGVPEGDVHLLVHIMHNWDDEPATEVLRSCRQAMRSGGKLLILDRVMPERIEPNEVTRANTLMDLMMLVRTRGGRERTATEFANLLTQAGLHLQRVVPLGIAESFVEATPV